MLKKSLHGYAIALVAFLLFLLVCPIFTQAQQLPVPSPSGARLLVASILFGSGLAKVVSETAPFQMTIQPYSGTSTFLRSSIAAKWISVSTMP
jgi:hypothetical protein